MTSKVITAVERREQVLAELTPVQREIYACFAQAVTDVYGTPLLRDCFVAMKGLVSVMQAHVNSHTADDGLEEHF